MTPNDPELPAKLHCLNALFADATQNDPFLIQTLREAIEMAITGTREDPAPVGRFAEKAVELWEKKRKIPAPFGFRQIDLNGRDWDPLWIREELLSFLRNLAGYRKSVLVVDGLEACLLAGRTRRTARMRRRYDEARRYIDALAARHASHGSCVTIFYIR